MSATFSPDVGSPRLPTTPIEVYKTRGGVDVYVKREDLCWPWPPLSKARGVWAALQARPNMNVAVVDTGRSVNGLLATTIGQTLRRKIMVGYPTYVADVYAGKDVLTPCAGMCRSLGASIIGVPANRQFVMQATMKRLLWTKDDPSWFLLPTGLRLPETVSAVEAEFATLPDTYGTVVVPTGTGTHLAGILRGILGKPTDVVAVQGYGRPVDRFRADVRRASGVDIPFTLVTSMLDYYEARPERLPPFPANVYYEVKAWAWLNQPGVAEGLPQPILFWNIGA